MILIGWLFHLYIVMRVILCVIPTWRLFLFHTQVHTHFTRFLGVWCGKYLYDSREKTCQRERSREYAHGL